MATFDVTLSTNKSVVFPRRCVVCERSNPDSELELSLLGAQTNSLALEVSALVLAGSSYSNNTSHHIAGIPACRGCVRGLKWYHRILKLATYTAWIPGLLVFFWLPTPKWLNAIFLLGFIVAPPILSMIFPPAFGATFLNNKATFEFKSERIAKEFSQLNQAAK